MNKFKAKLPEDLTRAMELESKGYITTPKQFYNFHEQLARQELKRLKTLGFQLLPDSVEMKSDGFGSRVLHATVVHGQHAFNLLWHTFNQEFFSKHSFGGASPLGLDDRSEGVYQDRKEEFDKVRVEEINWHEAV